MYNSIFCAGPSMGLRDMKQALNKFLYISLLSF